MPIGNYKLLKAGPCRACFEAASDGGNMFAAEGADQLPPLVMEEGLGSMDMDDLLSVDGDQLTGGA